MNDESRNRCEGGVGFIFAQITPLYSIISPFLVVVSGCGAWDDGALEDTRHPEII